MIVGFVFKEGTLHKVSYTVYKVPEKCTNDKKWRSLSYYFIRKISVNYNG